MAVIFCCMPDFSPAVFILPSWLPHLPGEVQLCGPASPTVASWSLAIIGLTNIAQPRRRLGVQNVRSKMILFWMYFSRAALVVMYLVAKNDVTFYLFAFGPRRHLAATVPPTAAIVGKLFRDSIFVHVVWFDPAVAPDRRILRRMAGRHCPTSQGNFQWMDRRHDAGIGGRVLHGRFAKHIAKPSPNPPDPKGT